MAIATTTPVIRAINALGSSPTLRSAIRLALLHGDEQSRRELVEWCDYANDQDDAELAAILHAATR